MAKIEKNVEIILTRASEEAKERRHEFICLEHLLYAIIVSDVGARILRACGGNPARLKHYLEDFFMNKLERLSLPLHTPPQTLAFQRVLQRAVYIQNIQVPKL